MQPEPTRALESPLRDEYDPSLGDILLTLWRWRWVVLLFPVLCAGAALGFSLVQEPVYESSVKVLIRQEPQRDATPGDLAGEMQGLQQLTQTVVEAIETRPIAKTVIARLDLRESPRDFLEKLNVEQVGATQFVEVSYEDSDPQRARMVAATVGTVLSDRILEMSPSANTITATVWEEAVVSDEPVSPDPLIYLLVAVSFGVVTGVALALLLEYLGTNWRSPEGRHQKIRASVPEVASEFGSYENKPPRNDTKGKG